MIEDAIWTLKTFQREQGNWFSVESKTLYVDFMEAWSWTIRNIRYMGDEIAGETGAHGSVVRVDTGAGPKDYHYIGTSHGFETVRSFSILVDGKDQQTIPGRACSGREVVVRKASNLGPFDHEMEITFSASGDCLVEKHSYKVVEDLNGRFTYLFAFMHCNNSVLDQWLTVLPDGKELEGKLPNRGDSGLSLERDVKSLILYSRAMRKGVTFVYPEIYKGARQIESEISQGTTGHFGNCIVDRKKDNKLYFRPEVKKMGYKPGDVFEYSLKVIPFLAEAVDWKDRGKTLAVFNKCSVKSILTDGE
jgi:hypothetical protein